MADSVDRVFAHALNTVKKIPRTGSARPPPEVRLRLYGLYKQSMEGDVEGIMSCPIDSSAEQDKWEAWHAQTGLPRAEAKRRYIATLITTMHTYAASNPSALALVSELEFLWDQLKSAPTSSASSQEPVPTSQREAARSQVYSSGVVSALGARVRGIRPPNTTQDEPDQEDRAERQLRLLAPLSQDDLLASPSRSRPSSPSSASQASAPHLFPPTSPPPSPSPNDPARETHTHIWRLSVESALAKLTAEVSALREQAAQTPRRDHWISLPTSPSALAKSLSALLYTTARRLLLDTALLLALLYLLNTRRTRAGFFSWLKRVRLRLRLREVLMLWLRSAGARTGNALSRLVRGLDAFVARKWDGRALVLDLLLLLPVLGLLGGRWGQVEGWLGVLGRAAERLVWRVLLRR